MSDQDRTGRGRIGGTAWRSSNPMRSALPEAQPEYAGHRPSAPGMGPVQSIRSVISKYIRFSGRARRSEYWWWVLATTILAALVGMIEAGLGMLPADASFGEGPLSAVAGLVVLLPSLTVTVRRLHDTDRSGWWLLAPLIPVVAVILLVQVAAISGAASAPPSLTLVVAILYAGIALSLILSLIILIWTVRKSQPGTNRFGPSPLEQDQ
ncbi:DUF805 domain-containing protein [Paracoccus aerodenitrificans]|uniref:DUF805 domain-containing protein n=1 Tax=Paracoccus aerodenitrificans TaxID=3017781 RepID=UPI0022F04E9A|nr:DUF805 domain-containing protein [Paracoccus aerodenitrificans]WBU65072.1 DUF805 domain-containing protein [Paracoccus aerodenitrificans]